MKYKNTFKFLVSLLFFVSLHHNALANEIEKDPFTVHIQEILIDLGFLDTPPTGINDTNTRNAIMTFQEKAGLEKLMDWLETQLILNYYSEKKHTPQF